MTNNYERAASELFSAKGWAKAEEYLAELEKKKKPTENFHKVQEALEILQDLVFDDDKIELSYEGYHGTILVKTVGFSVPMYNMDVWRDLMDVVDGIAIEQRFDVICIELTCKDIFA